MSEETEVQPLEVDATSDAVVLAYVGDGTKSARGAPPRDLTGNDLARLAYVERIREVAGDVGQPVDTAEPEGDRFERPDPRDPDPAIVGAIAADLLASEQFEKPKRKRTPKSDEPEQPAATPEPEG